MAARIASREFTGVQNIGRQTIESDSLAVELTSLLHRRQPTVLSLVLRIALGPELGARFDRCQCRACRSRWGRDGCGPHREVEERLTELSESTREHSTVVMFVHSDPEAILAVIR